MTGPVTVLHVHARTSGDVLHILGVNPARGLSSDEAAVRLRQYGANVLAEGRRRGPLRLLASQFADFMILVLIAAAVISGIIGDLTDTLVIIAIVALNAIIGFVQEYRAERAIAALRQMAAPSARVLRNGRSEHMDAGELVPGDIVLLDAGNLVPADLRLLESAQLRTQEAALTGESEPVHKSVAPLREPGLPLGDRTNMAFKGTLVVHGRGRGVVVATGMATELGHIAQLLHQTEDTRTPLQRRLTRFGRILAVVVLLISATLFATGLLRGEPPVLMLLTAISLAVAAIPEALPAVVTVALALGARKMVLRHALIRKLPAVETLGSVTFICTDKTGTLTLNRMRVEALFCDGITLSPPPIEPPASATAMQLFQAMALNNDAHVDHAGAVVGDPTEVALFEAARDAGFVAEELAERMPRTAELPFDAQRSCMTTLHASDAGLVAYTKGSPEKVLSLCRDTYPANGRQNLDRTSLLAEAERMAADGLRVLAFACRHFPQPPVLEPEHVETEMSFLGLAGLMDPPRDEVRDAVALCRSAGITPVMITGDHPATARAVAERLGILEKDGEVLSGSRLATLSDDEFAAHVGRVRVYARAAPEQKIRIVKALQDRGEYVAMTGDGVNDAPALRRADIGVAMGVTGTDVAKEASHMILLDDNFASIVGAVREGRRIFDNIRKFIRFVMAGNSGEMITLSLAPFFGLPIPLLPIHILWVNLVTDGLPGLALTAEREERGLMQRPPRPPGESIFAHGMWQHILWVGLLLGAICIGIQAWALHAGDSHWQTMVFTVLTLAQMFHVLAIRSERESLFTLGLLSNWPLLGAVLLTFALQLATIYVPVLNPIFRTEPLTLTELSLCLALSSVVLVAVETEKALIRRGRLYRERKNAGRLPYS
jgi:Ca2+-transporting ATPase